MSNNTTAQSGGIGFCGALALLFIALKLLGHISWSWVWVLSPLWIPATAAVMFIVFLILVGSYIKSTHKK